MLRSIYLWTLLSLIVNALMGCQERGHKREVTSQVDREVMNSRDRDVGSDVDGGIIGEQVVDMTSEFTSPDYQLDDTLRMNHLQALGTHNSYHLASEIDVLPWRYSHLPLNEQLEQQGVRQFELDIYERDQVFKVFHFERLDQNTTCETLEACLESMKNWSDQHPFHHPLLVLLEVKDIERSSSGAVDEIERLLTEVWGENRLLTPRLVQRQYSTLRTGLETEGWPSLGEVRGRLLAVLHEGGALRDALIESEDGLRSRLLFPDAYGDLNAPYAAYHSINDPIASFEHIQQVVNAGHLVRTRSDVDGIQLRDLDYTRGEQALLSGAHWISTDYPRPPQEAEYGFVIPEGTPSRCNPLTAPHGCESQQIE